MRVQSSTAAVRTHMLGLEVLPMQRVLLASTIALVLAATACASDTDDGNDDDKTVQVNLDPKQANEKTGDNGKVAEQATDSPLYSPAAFATDSPLY